MMAEFVNCPVIAAWQHKDSQTNKTIRFSFRLFAMHITDKGIALQISKSKIESHKLCERCLKNAGHYK